MKTNDITKATDPTMRGALNALLRAAAAARKIAIQTDTNLVIVKDGQLRRLSADELRQQDETKHTANSSDTI
jgi:hypothetical protein